MREFRAFSGKILPKTGSFCAGNRRVAYKNLGWMRAAPRRSGFLPAPRFHTDSKVCRDLWLRAAFHMKHMVNNMLWSSRFHPGFLLLRLRVFP
jgi:hypothetical protein